RFPADFDGIIAGAPGIDWTGRAAQAVRVAHALEGNPAARLLQPERQLLHRAVVEACDTLDGVKDGLPENPTKCRFDPAVLPFITRGGKMIQYHGWSDPQISPASSVQYYARAIDASGANGGAAAVSASYRLFLAPGMGHCAGGEGPNSFDMVAALEQWVEKGK